MHFSRFEAHLGQDLGFKFLCGLFEEDRIMNDQIDLKYIDDESDKRLKLDRR